MRTAKNHPGTGSEPGGGSPPVGGNRPQNRSESRGPYRLSKRQRLFAEGIASGLTAKEAALGAGYAASTAESQTGPLLRNVRVIEYLSVLQGKVEQVAGPAIATSRELQVVLTSIVRDTLSDPVDRIRAAESLMRIRGTAGDASDRCPHCGEPVDQEPHTTLNVTLEATLRRVLETPRTTEEPADVRL